MHQQRFAQLTKCLTVCPIIAILRGLDPNNAAEIGLSLYKAGVRVIEVPLNSPVRPLESIRNLLSAFLHLPKDERPVIGAGTVLSVDDVMNVVAAGGEVALSPNTDTDVIQQLALLACLFFQVSLQQLKLFRL
jgi:2-dehydro-3-deoxyphosphogalactonate aldolase